MAPFIGNANAGTNGYLSPIQIAIVCKKTESIKLLAPFCDDYYSYYGNGLIVIIRKNSYNAYN